MNIPPKILNHFKKNDPIIYEILKEVNMEDWYRPDSWYANKQNYFASLCRIVVGQQLSGRAARTIYSRFEDLIGTPLTANKILKTKHEKLRSVGLSNSKATYVKNVAEAIDNNKINLNNLDNLSDKEVVDLITEIKGFGTWSAEMFLMFTLKRDDVFSDKDLGLKKAVFNLYKIEYSDTKKINKLLNKWTPYKTYASIALWNSLNKR